ncbi:ommochrome-binding protein-like [Pieris napi]|uniref:ommochrome-binding protein-like n=1 Tax=Pieris napi TaxID=78633 RepID=UPI001FB9772E|nr:ommochrome-binding protein-like [Pieris napi]
MFCDIKMLFAILLPISLVASQEPCPTCVRGNGTCYNVSYVFDIDAPFRNRVVIHKLALLRSSNTLFYSFEPRITDPEYYKVGSINIDDPTNSSVVSVGKIMNFGTFDLDQDNGLVYLGGGDGIYVLDTKVDKVAPYSSRGDTVLSLFYKGNVYFVTYGDSRVVKKKGDNFEVIVEHTMPVKTFVVNKDYVTVCLSTYGLFASKKDEIVWLSYNPYFRGIAIDRHDAIYTWWLDGIYKVIIEKNLSESRIVKVVYIDDVGSLTFDLDNNFIFTSGKSLYRLNDLNITCDGSEKKKKIRI